MSLSNRILSSTLVTLLLVNASTFTIVAQTPITGVTATTTMGSGTPLANMLDGSGLSSYSLTATHSATYSFNSWVSSSQLTGSVTFNLGGLYNLGAFSFWNQNAGGPGALGSTGIKNVSIFHSNDGFSYQPLLGAPTSFSRMTGNMSTAEQFNFSPVSASNVRFDILSNYGDTARTGYAEVMFASVVPEPSTLALIALGFSTLFQTRRKN